MITNSDVHKKILCSNKAHFEWLNGYVNRHNCGIWSDSNPQTTVETPVSSQKSLLGVIYEQGVSLVYNAGHNVTVNEDRFRALVNCFFVPNLEDFDMDDLWFQ